MEMTEHGASKPRFHLDMISGADSTRQLSDLLEDAFEVPVGRRFFDDFPVWDEEIVAAGEKLARFGAFSSNGELAASACARIADLKIGKGRVTVALIGAVATREKYRGAGLAS